MSHQLPVITVRLRPNHCLLAILEDDGKPKVEDIGYHLKPILARYGIRLSYHRGSDPRCYPGHTSYWQLRLPSTVECWRVEVAGVSLYVYPLTETWEHYLFFTEDARRLVIFAQDCAVVPQFTGVIPADRMVPMLRRFAGEDFRWATMSDFPEKALIELGLATADQCSAGA